MRELPDRQRRSVDGTRREHRGDPRPILQPRLENRLMIRDLVATRPRDVLDRDGEISDFERALGNRLERSLSLDKNAPSAGVDHDLSDRWIDQEILDWPEERQDSVEAAHKAPCSRWSK